MTLAAQPAPAVGLEHALAGLVAAASPPQGTSSGAWRWQVHRRMGAVRDALVAEVGGQSEAWLAARGGTTSRERGTLLARLGTTGAHVLADGDAPVVRRELDRLLVDLGRHVQRLHDLAYDEVELELGGSD
ncbi:hypothetical protein QWY28_03850 [Nocardioides sp. SOB77]|uniref:DUF4254 domain-containing protein n=1 Tax=Nocardioides oceani TaxID=3058369 RepID=A0ABT8FCE3_9ACTN|nr:hypothetical protein [Nocardioides oceani]MDN4172067.1 hypothetical protein [Nocardioides oceani]